MTSSASSHAAPLSALKDASHHEATRLTSPDAGTPSSSGHTMTDPLTGPKNNFIVRVEHLTKRVSTAEAELVIVNHAGFSVEAGDTVAVVGASGSGKSTLLGLMAGLDTPTEGKVFIDGEDLFALDEDGRAKLRGRLVGFVFQSFQLLPSLTALENVMLPLELGRVADAAIRARSILDRVGLRARVTHYPKQLSGGEQQRVAIARAFVTAPKLLFADEPTGNLDAKTGRAMIDLLFELNRERGTTLILVTHDAGLAARCGRRLHIDAGVVSTDDDRIEMAM